MKNFFLFFLSMFVSATAFANFYIEGFGGFNFVESYEDSFARIDLNTGYVVGGALGYRFSGFFRLEGEAAYRSNTFDKMVVDGMQFSTSGSIKKVTAMANGIIEIPFLGKTFIPYAGGGLVPDRKSL